MADTEDYAETLRSMSFSSLLDERDWAKAGDSDCRRRKRRAVNAELDARWERIAASATHSPQPAPSVERCPEFDCVAGTFIHENGMKGKCSTCNGTGKARR